SRHALIQLFPIVARGALCRSRPVALSCRLPNGQVASWRAYHTQPPTAHHLPCLVCGVWCDREATPIGKMHDKTPVFVGVDRSHRLAHERQGRTERFWLLRRQALGCFLLLQDEGSLNTDGGCIVALPEFDPKSAVHKAACDHFPLERYDPTVT